MRSRHVAGSNFEVLHKAQNKHTKYASVRAMEVELGLRIATQPRNLTFATSETDVAIVILGHLPGIRQEDINISVNDEGTAVTISGRGNRFLSHAVTSGRRLRLSNEVETQPFCKVFRIPNVVILDQINASFDEEGSILMVLMPKHIRGESSLSEAEEEPIQDRIQSDEEISSCQEHPPEPETSEAGRGGEEESIQDRIQSDEAKFSRQRHPPEPETSEACRDADSKISEQETSPNQGTNERIEDSKTDRAPQNQQSTGLDSQDEIEKRENKPDPPRSPSAESIETLDLDDRRPLTDAPEPDLRAEQEEPIKEADLVVHTVEGIAPKQDLSGKVEGEANAPKSNVTSGIPPEHQEIEKDEPLKEVDLDVHTPKAITPKQDQSGKVEGETNAPKSNVTPGIPPEYQKIEMKEPLKEANLDVHTPEVIAPKQDQLGKVEGEANAPKPNVTPGILRSEHQETKKEESLKEVDIDVHTPEATAPKQYQSRKVEGEANTPKPNVTSDIPRSEHHETEKEEPFKEADLDVQTPEATTPKQDQSEKVEGEANTSKPNVTPGIPRFEHQEAEMEKPIKEADLDVHTPESTAPKQDQSEKVEGEVNAPEPNVTSNIPLFVHQEAEMKKPIKEADLDVHTPESTAPKQDQSGKVKGGVNAPEPNVMPSIPLSVHQEGGDNEISPEKSADRMPTMEMTSESDDVVAKGHHQVVDTGNEEDENDDETRSEASSEEWRKNDDGQPKEEKNGKKGRVRRRRRTRNGQASSRLPPLPHLVGSAFIFSLVALIAHYMRNRRRGS